MSLTSTVHGSSWIRLAGWGARAGLKSRPYHPSFRTSVRRLWLGREPISPGRRQGIVLDRLLAHIMDACEHRAWPRSPGSFRSRFREPLRTRSVFEWATSSTCERLASPSSSIERHPGQPDPIATSRFASGSPSSTRPPGASRHASPLPGRGPPGRAAGRARGCTAVAALVDTNILVYRFDGRFPAKQVKATALLRAGIADDSIRVPHQALVEFVAAVSKPMGRGVRSILSPEHARREVEEMFGQFEVLYPDDTLQGPPCEERRRTGSPGSTRTSGPTRSATGSRRSGPRTFEHGRRYGRVRVVNPFL
jgi:hypothetical protein